MSAKPLGLILCGGQSRRMGQDKWQLRIYGKTWAEYLASLLEPLCEKVYFSSTKELDIPNASFVIDRYPDEGPLAGWQSFAEDFPGRDLLSLPVDMPLLTAATVELLGGVKSGFLAGPHEKAPLAAFLRAADLEALSVQFSEGLRSAFSFWEGVEHQEFQLGSDRELKNINMARDLPNKR